MKLVTLLFFSLISTLSLADGNPERGEGKSGVCAACHGADGIASIPGYPNLAGQNYEYLVAQLKAFKSGERKNGNATIMAPMTAGLSEQDIKDLAAFYSQMER